MESTQHPPGPSTTESVPLEQAWNIMTGPIAVQAWNIMAGIDWNALPTVVEMLGVKDVESLIYQLIVIRDWKK